MTDDNLKIRLFIEAHKALWDEYAEYVVARQHLPRRTELVGILTELKLKYGLIPDTPPYLATIARMYHDAKRQDTV